LPNDLLHPVVQKFILDHAQDDVNQLVLRYKEIESIPVSRIADQITGRKKAKEKLPGFYNTPSIVYPPGLNLEQSSSEKTAQYKTDFIASDDPVKKPLNSMADLTGGFGVDSYFFSKIFRLVHYVEPNESLVEIVRHNHQQLGADNIHYHQTKAEEFLKTHHEPMDLVFIDPSRRSTGNQKVFKFSDCVPDVTALQQSIFEKTHYLLVKTSPLLDLQQGLKELDGIKKILVIAVDNECKEVLFFCEKNFTNEPEVTAVNILPGKTDRFSFGLREEKNAGVNFSEPLTYLFEPNAALLKSGAFKILAERTGLLKLHPSTHLYTSSTLVHDFPGRVFKLESPLKSDPKEVLKFFPEGKANVFTRNYPLSVDELRKKLKLKDGGYQYLVAFTGMTGKLLYAAQRIS
jgi:hypothetical protein